MSENNGISEDAQPPKRNDKGQLLPGEVLNPTGWNGLKGRARWEKIVEYYMQNWSVQELKDMATKEKELAKMPIEYAQVIIHLAGTLTGKDKRGEREALYDRLWGYPVQSIQELAPDKPLPKDIDQMVKDNPAAAEKFMEEVRRG